MSAAASHASSPEPAGASAFLLVANVSLLFADRPLLERPAAAAAAGFQAVEAWWPWPDTAVPTTAQVDDFVHCVTESGLPLTGLNLFAGDMPNGERGIVSVPDRRREFAANLDVVLDIAARTGCRGFNALYGQRRTGWSAAQQDACARENLTLATARLADVGGTVLIEALSRGLNGAYPIETAAQAVDVLHAVRADGGRTNIGLLFDTFHLANNDEDLLAVIDRYSDLIAHVQLADAPGRGQPGTGAVDIASVLQRLWTSGYRGAVACEYAPTGTTLDTLGWLDTAPHLRRLPVG